MGPDSLPAESATAAKVLALLPSLILQKPRRAVGAHGVWSDRCLNQRINWWKYGDLEKLWDEARRTAERRARQLGSQEKKPPDEDETPAERIINLVRSGDIRGANAMLDPQKRGKGLPVEVTQEIKKQLQVLHPPARPIAEDLLLPEGDTEKPVDWSLVWAVDEEMIASGQVPGTMRLSAETATTPSMATKVMT